MAQKTKEKLYLVIESTTIAEYNNRKEAEVERDKQILFYPENDYKVIEHEIEF